MAMRVAGNKGGDGDSNGNNVGNGNGDEDGGHVTAAKVMVISATMMWAMVTATRVADGNGEESKCNGNDESGGKQQRGQRHQGNGNGNKKGGRAAATVKIKNGVVFWQESYNFLV